MPVLVGVGVGGCRGVSGGAGGCSARRFPVPGGVSGSRCLGVPGGVSGSRGVPGGAGGCRLPVSFPRRGVYRGEPAPYLVPPPPRRSWRRLGSGRGSAICSCWGATCCAGGGCCCPTTPPYNTGAFRFELTFSPHHPLAPPRARLLTSIYHPGVDEDGHVCQPLTSHDHWQATTRAVHVLQDLLLLLDSPDTERGMRQQLVRELSEQPEIFWRRAEEHTRRHAEPRPEPPGS
ncbi:ubiquitin-conjugating enzyme E2-18 kDa-like [Oxyura jamaicensis]|uniref:ubiquitin-conjugating enzyme E2-18 kDa-like n=1 Tax=Oxyura jamaicensis TaxID=8884 RepID=UPI0015A53956|nr:ubiquitin-conjugating enzyme E2-18 kDa-like [Oxyura jamaicensis]